MGYLSGIREKIWQPIYDGVDAVNGDAITTFFDTQASGAKRQDRTNLRIAGQLPAPYMFLVQGFKLEMAPAVTSADAQALMTRSVLQFFINAKPYFEIPCRKIGGGNNVWIAASMTGNGAPSRAFQNSNGPPDCRNYYHLKIPIKIGVLENFRATITYPGTVTLAATTRLKFYLEGVLKRSVQ